MLALGAIVEVAHGRTGRAAEDLVEADAEALAGRRVEDETGVLRPGPGSEPGLADRLGHADVGGNAVDIGFALYGDVFWRNRHVDIRIAEHAAFNAGLAGKVGSVDRDLPIDV